MNLDVDKTEKEAIGSIVSLSRKRVLEIGCGPGWRTGLFVRPDNHVTAVDVCDKMIKMARRRMPQVAFIQGSIYQLEFDPSIDLVVFSRSLHHFPAGKDEKLCALHRAKRISPHGQILVIEPGLDGDSTKIANLFRPEKEEIVDTLRALMDCHLAIVNQLTVTVRQIFVDFDEFFRFFFSVECSDPFPPMVKKVRDVMGINDPSRSIHLSDTANIILFQ